MDVKKLPVLHETDVLVTFDKIIAKVDNKLRQDTVLSEARIKMLKAQYRMVMIEVKKTSRVGMK
jgi:hypothetical protein